jgi:hypothetical protein
MARKKHLKRRQLALIDDLFGGELEEQAVLDKHNVSRNVYNNWLTEEGFADELSRRIVGARLQSEALIAKYSLLAASKLVQLTESESQETARKACLDIISLPQIAAKRPEQSEKVQNDNLAAAEQLSPETASRVLAALAKEKEEAEK